MTGRSIQVFPKTESTVFKVWVIVCGVDSLCRLVAFRFFFLLASWMGTVVINLGVSVRGKCWRYEFFRTTCICARAQVRVCMDTYVVICRSEVSVYRRSFFWDAAPCSWVHHHVGLRFDTLIV